LYDEPTVEILASALRSWDIELTQLQRQSYARYAELLVDWNATKVNLTRLTSPEQIAIQHFLDSIAVTRILQIERGARALDIGTGAGFPGIALKIMRPDLSLTLMEATGKKLAFCHTVCDELGLDNVAFVHARAEDVKVTKPLLHLQDLVTARAVGSLAVLFEWASPYLSSSKSRFVAWKGPSARRELHEAQSVVSRLRMRAKVAEVVLPESGEPRRVNSFVVSQLEV